MIALPPSLGPRAALTDERVAQSRRAVWFARDGRARPHRCRLRRHSSGRTPSLHSLSSASSKEGRTRDLGAVGANVQWTGPLPQGATPEITTFNWIVDDIVAWTGEAIMSSPGGRRGADGLWSPLGWMHVPLDLPRGPRFPGLASGIHGADGGFLST